jgi:glc operon protein GlcG
MKLFDITARGLSALALAALSAHPASAQVTEKSSVSLAGARQVIAAAIAEAKAKRAPGGVIAVVDDGGNLVALERLDGTFAAGANISIGKARTAALFKRPTSFFEEVIKKGRTPMVALNDFTPLQGGVPIVVGDQVVGAVGVSGAASAQQDEELAIAGAAALARAGTNGDTNAPPPVSYWKAPDVAAAFSKGAVLFDGKDGRNFMVHASHRDKAGQAEVHDVDTDIIYVLEGSATFVTGGTVQGGKVTEPNELRGDAIADGETREIGRGDVLIVPNGTPHWFKAVKGPLNYYVVKVR